jgi:hypothetical protein
MSALEVIPAGLGKEGPCGIGSSELTSRANSCASISLGFVHLGTWVLAFGLR